MKGTNRINRSGSKDTGNLVGRLFASQEKGSGGALRGRSSDTPLKSTQPHTPTPRAGGSSGSSTMKRADTPVVSAKAQGKSKESKHGSSAFEGKGDSTLDKFGNKVVLDNTPGKSPSRSRGSLTRGIMRMTDPNEWVNFTLATTLVKKDNVVKRDISHAWKDVEKYTSLRKLQEFTEKEVSLEEGTMALWRAGSELVKPLWRSTLDDEENLAENKYSKDTVEEAAFSLQWEASFTRLCTSVVSSMINTMIQQYWLKNRPLALKVMWEELHKDIVVAVRAMSHTADCLIRMDMKNKAFYDANMEKIKKAREAKDVSKAAAGASHETSKKGDEPPKAVTGGKAKDAATPKASAGGAPGIDTSKAAAGSGDKAEVQSDKAIPGLEDYIEGDFIYVQSSSEEEEVDMEDDRSTRSFSNNTGWDVSNPTTESLSEGLQVESLISYTQYLELLRILEVYYQQPSSTSAYGKKGTDDDDKDLFVLVVKDLFNLATLDRWLNLLRGWLADLRMNSNKTKAGFHRFVNVEALRYLAQDHIGWGESVLLTSTTLLQLVITTRNELYDQQKGQYVNADFNTILTEVRAQVQAAKTEGIQHNTWKLKNEFNLIQSSLRGHLDELSADKVIQIFMVVAPEKARDYLLTQFQIRVSTREPGFEWGNLFENATRETVMHFFHWVIVMATSLDANAEGFRITTIKLLEQMERPTLNTDIEAKVKSFYPIKRNKDKTPNPQDKQHKKLSQTDLRHKIRRIHEGTPHGSTPKGPPKKDPAKKAGDGKCRNCNEEGHFAKDCPKPHKCLNCEKLGHYDDACLKNCRHCGGLCYKGNEGTAHMSRNCPKNPARVGKGSKKTIKAITPAKTAEGAAKSKKRKAAEKPSKKSKRQKGERNVHFSSSGSESDSSEDA